MLFGSSVLYEVFRKNLVHFCVWGLWYVKLSPLCSVAHGLIISSPSLFFIFIFFFTEGPLKVQVSGVQNKPFFPRQNLASVLFRMTLLPNMLDEQSSHVKYLGARGTDAQRSP